MKRGELVTVSVPGDYGKPRPAVVIQPDELEDTDSVVLCLLTTVERDASILPHRGGFCAPDWPEAVLANHGGQDRDGKAREMR